MKIGVVMKSNAILFISSICLAQVGLAGTLEISGTVLDRGFTLIQPNSNGPKLLPQQDSNVKVFIAEMKASSRTPQSVAPKQSSTAFSSINGWKKLTGLQTITTSSYIKVEAP